MFAIGQAVVLAQAGEQRVGEVVGVRAVAGETLYEVSLEDVVRKGVWEDELCEATPAAIQAMLGWLALDTQVAGEAHVAQPAREALRSAVLRQAYVEFLQQALDATTRREGQAIPDAAARFGVGDVVAFLDDGAQNLAEVRRVTVSQDEITYMVEALGEIAYAKEGQLVPVERASRLGTRAHLAAAGHERDDDFAGTICQVRCDTAEVRYALMFDDGDILTDLAEDDLI